MVETENPRLAKVYSARNANEQREAYNAWASEYERDTFAYGIRIQANAAAAFTAFIPGKQGPFLDAACGTGVQVEPLCLLGYGPFTGIDLSDGMIEAARAKNIYTDLQQAKLGEPLPFADGHFAGCLCTGALAQNHAPPETFEELTRVTRAGGKIVVSIHADEGLARYLDAIHDLEKAGRLKTVFTSAPFTSMPLADPSIQHIIYVLEVTS